MNIPMMSGNNLANRPPNINLSSKGNKSLDSSNEEYPIKFIPKKNW